MTNARKAKPMLARKSEATKEGTAGRAGTLQSKSGKTRKQVIVVVTFTAGQLPLRNEHRRSELSRSLILMGPECKWLDPF